MNRATEVTARLEGRREELLEILCDLDRLDAWVPGIESSQVLTREGDVAIAELRIPEWADRSFNLEVVHASRLGLDFQQIDSIGHPEISGRIELGDTAPGVGTSSVKVRIVLRLEISLWSFGTRKRVRSALRASFDALGARRRQLAASRRDSGDRKQKLLEVFRESTGLRIWYLGESFLLPKAAGEGR